VTEKTQPNGVLLVNKPKGMTSHDVVAFLRRKLQMTEVGHAGTLDPMAEGLLVCLLGDTTKLSDFLLNENKAYLAKVRFGIRTDTMDLEGEVLENREVHVDGVQLKMAVTALQGDFQWPVPIFSAVKKDGKKLYEHARANEAVELPVRMMSFPKAEIKAQSSTEVDVEIACSKGSFIRTWASQLGEKLGVPSVLAGLTRTKSEPYHLDRSLTLGEIESLDTAKIMAHQAYIPFDQCLPGLKGLSVRGKDLKLVMNGQVPHDIERRLVPDQRARNATGGSEFLRILDGETGQLRALLQLAALEPVKIRRVFKRP